MAVTGGPPFSASAIAGEDRAGARLVELADRWDRRRSRPSIAVLSRWKMPLFEWKGAAALILPGAGDGGDRQRRMHGDGAVALAREAVAEAEEGPLRRADEPGEALDLLHGEAGDRGRPFRRAALRDAPRAPPASSV